jgi:hypothetical protein
VRKLAFVCAAAVLCVSCTADLGDHAAGFRVLKPGSVVSYRLDIRQARTASGLGPRKILASSASVDVDEEARNDHGYVVLVRSARASGEDTQKTAANRMAGRRIGVDLSNGRPTAVSKDFSGTKDVTAVDTAMLLDLLAPLLPKRDTRDGERWRVVTRKVRQPWAAHALYFTIDNEVTKTTRFHGLDARVVRSTALANVTFRVPLVVPAPAAPGGPKKYLVNELFSLLFSDIHDPIHATAAAIAAIPLFVAAPFLAIGQAIADMFGGSKPTEDDFVVDLSGPVRFVSSTTIWTRDGRVLAQTATGGMTLSGQIPRLGGGAASLSGKTLHLDASWTFARRHVSPLPEPTRRSLLLLVLAAVLAAAAAILSVVLRARKPG